MSSAMDQYLVKIYQCLNSRLPAGTAVEQLPHGFKEKLIGDFFDCVIAIVGRLQNSIKPVRQQQKHKSLFFLGGQQLQQEQQQQPQQGFFYIGGKEAVLDIESGLIWSSRISEKTIDKNSFGLLRFDNSDFYDWMLPEAISLCEFAKKSSNPLRGGGYDRLSGFDYFITCQGRVYLAFSDPNSVSDNSARCIPVSDKYKDNYVLLILDCLLTGRQITLSTSDKVNLLEDISKPINFTESQADLDSYSLPSPPLDERQIHDQACGLWEFWSDDSTEQGKQANRACLSIGIRPRNPIQDIQPGAVAIDFGTSSTVVAFKDGGRKKLLRIGLSVDDYSADSQPEHYENPTILEFVDIEALLQPWQSQAYRPRVSWEDVHCSHEALSTQRDNESDPKITASILPKIKQWALRMEDDVRIRIRDRAHERELELPPLEMRNPIKGQPLKVSSSDSFDPIELYAWFLGLAINQRSRGLFLKYYMTFPVAYPRDVKEKILCSFRRGLQRSLPETLIKQKAFEKFAVEERASEPAAFAAAALEHFKLKPTEQGVAYGVFDFGGGTTDFDFGIYRLPTVDEEDQGYEQVIEHFGASGDRFLGGENLLENMAYRVFQHNADTCRKEGVTFSKPLDADDFPASETLLSNSQAALTNTLMLMARLRPFWEKGEQVQDGIVSLPLISNESSTRIELRIPYDELAQYLKDRLREGVEKFLQSMKEAFDHADKQPEKIHVFLAGNASRSPLLQELFSMAAQGSSQLAVTLKVSDIIGHCVSEVTAIDCGLEVGEEVEFEDGLMFLETDKGTNDVVSPVDGVIHQKFVNSGDTLQSDSKLLEIALKEGAAVPKGITAYRLQGFENASEGMQVYPPIMNDPSSPYSPNTKTGVALGLLELCPGSATAIVNHSANQKGGEAPFNFYVGTIKRRCFHPGVVRHAQFGKWQELGIIREGHFNLAYTQNPLATSGNMTEDHLELEHQQLEMPCSPGERLFARAIASNRIEVCSASSLSELQQAPFDNHMTLEL
ncbi:biotin/lipoyl-containing protein [Parathalassolituus penaei]|uniref:Lipoyl-binding domain-containing protein n=1 Tax=Parathalassolituus penaei TaxID=2997323 RepID=A0A9X3EM49_9GAMM|nr:biotin/lipoyl-containing protein [Parathalassolituus penaei]MCY0965173.1 hypothetical protein [Parathalassolituus penaei]